VTEIDTWDDPLVTAAGEGTLPSGTVTLLLADIEGSTHLWEHRGEDMPALLTGLDDAVSALVPQHGGARPV
jgi:class 3 adenylate cyclase